MSDRGGDSEGQQGSRRRRVIKAVPPHNPKPSTKELQEHARLAEETTTALTKVRANAENWRTGMAGLITLVTATLLFKGRDSIADYDSWARYALGALTMLALAAGVVSLLLFLSAAHGRPEAVSAQSVIDEGGIQIRDVRLATDALSDLQRARKLAIASAATLAAALILSWYGPTAPSSPAAFVRLTYQGAAGPQTICGILKAQNATTTAIQVIGEPDPRRIPTTVLVSVVLVASC